MEFTEFLRKRRSVRAYKADDVPMDLLMEIISDSCLAPSHGNGQPWRYVVIKDRGCIRMLSDESKGTLLKDSRENPGSVEKRYIPLLKRPSYNVFYNAPCLVLIAGHRKVPSLLVDCALAAAYFMLSASARGLGTCWVGMGRHIRSPETLKKIGVPLDHEIVAPIIVGYPKKMPPAAKRNDPEILKVITC